AIRRGPLVYCLEQTDNHAAIERVRLPRNASLSAENRDDLFGGIVTIVTDGGAEADADDWADRLYRTEPPKYEATRLTAVPYYLWNNREAGRMLVWIPEA